MRDIGLRERQKHGVPDFPMQYYFVDAQHPRYHMELHWHREFEVLRVASGELELFLDNTRYLLSAGDMAFITSGMLHRATPHDAVYECVVFDLNMLCRHGSGRITGYILPLLSEGASVVPLADASHTVLGEAVERFFTCIKESGPYFELRAYAAAAETVYLLYTEGRVSLPRKNLHMGHRKTVITALLQWIEENYTEKFTLAELAAVANTSEKYLCRFFKEYTGSTPFDYVNRLRVERACVALTQSDLNVTEVAFGCGFNDAAYFCKIFKRYQGMTPREYRAVVERHAKGLPQ
ncbi:MAG: helix-turn-helix transcriptional regulator [Clostridia bacterium]|nr:helix-turn-helix transcriptional regulator [Clostridia bacterium]